MRRNNGTCSLAMLTDQRTSEECQEVFSSLLDKNIYVSDILLLSVCNICLLVTSNSWQLEEIC